MSTNNSNVRKKKVVKKNNKNTVNKKLFTGDKNEESVTKATFPNGVTLKIKEIRMQIVNKEEEQKKKLLELKNQTTQLEQELNSLKSKYETGKKEDIEKLKILNEELENKTDESKIISKENKKLITKLKGIEKELNETYNKVINLKLYKKKKENIKSEKTIETEIKSKEEEIKIMEKIVHYSKKEHQKYQNLLNDKNNGAESDIKREFEDIKEEIEQIKAQNEKLSEIKLKHQNCIKEIQKLKSKLNILYNEIEFETKKNDMIEAITLINTEKTEYQEPVEDNINNNKYLSKLDGLVLNKNIYAKNVRDKILQQSIPTVQSVNKSTSNYVKKEFELLQKSQINNNLIRSQETPTSVIDNVLIPQQNLFTERETEVLRKIIPDYFINEYLEKFDMKKQEKELIEDIIEEQKQEKKEIKAKEEKIISKTDYNKMKFKIEENKKKELNAKFNKNKKKIFNLNSEIKKAQKEIEQQGATIKRLNKINKNIKDKLESGNKNINDKIESVNKK